MKGFGCERITDKECDLCKSWFKTIDCKNVRNILKTKKRGNKMTKEKLDRCTVLIAKLTVLQEILDESKKVFQDECVVKLVLETDNHILHFEDFAPKQYNEMWRKAIEVIKKQYDAYEKEFNEL